MKKLLWVLSLAFVAMVSACSSGANEEGQQEVNLYTHRHYDTDQALYDEFEKETGIKVNVVSANADELIKRLEIEGENSPADVLVTVDAGRLHRAKSQGLFQSVESDILEKQLPSHLQDVDNQWFAVTKRARVIVYSKERVNPDSLKNYEDLTAPLWKERVVMRSSENTYNQSLLASIINHKGEDEALNWAKGVVENFAREPKGGDRDQIKAIAAGQGDVSLVNTYYIGRMLTSDEKEAAEQVGIIFPNQETTGTHVNVSGAGVTAHAPNRENAIKFIEFMLSEKAQRAFADTNFEYPVRKGMEANELLKSWGDFKEDDMNLSRMGELNTVAVKTFDRAGWK